MKSIAVFCGSSIGFNSDYASQAKILGQFLVSKKISLIYGGGKIGMMGVLADTMIELNGHVVGVIPEFLKHHEVVHQETNDMLVTDSMSERKVIMSKSVDAYIALAGGFGTLDELFEVLTLGQLGIEQKPVGLLNTNGYFDGILIQLDKMVEEGFLKQANRDMVLVSEELSHLFEKMNKYKAPKLTKIVNTVASK